jgi:hypothetical protein
MGTQTDIRATNRIATDEYNDGSGGIHSPYFRHSLFATYMSWDGDVIVCLICVKRFSQEHTESLTPDVVERNLKGGVDIRAIIFERQISGKLGRGRLALVSLVLLPPECGDSDGDTAVR